jgi:OPA family glycerol-3-phosphate transporter-like MFS transporter/OPA family sugar phosphate sensor protein UhpC-like MFS transporter
LQTYNGNITPNNCYLGCYNAETLDGVYVKTLTDSPLDECPVIWGGYGFFPNYTGIYEIKVPSDNFVVKITNTMDDGSINWGDGSPIEKYGVIDFDISQSANADKWITHTYASAGTYTIKGKTFLSCRKNQGAGFPPCNRLITHWVPPKELATKMSIWNVSHSLGGSLVAILCGSIIATMGVNMSGNAEVVNRIANNLFSKSANSLAAEELEVVTQYASHVGSWQMVFWIPALIGVIGVIFIFLSIRDTPKSVGLEELKGTETVLDKDDSKEAYRAFVKKMVWKNPLIWTLAIADFFVYIIRGIVFDWGPTFLTEAHFLDPQQAGYAISAFEVVGIFGILTSGWISDKLFGGKAQRVCAIYMGATAVFAGLFFLLPSGSGSTIITILVGGIGFFLYGPQALLGVVAANHATKKAASTALGVIGFTSYLSTIVSGAMIGFFLQKNIFNWSNVFLFMFAIALVGTIIMASLWKLKGDGYQNSKE